MAEPYPGPEDRAPLVTAVGELLREVAATAILPVYRHLGEDDVSEKAPGEVVTVADREAERLLSIGLTRLLPGSVVVGEEGVAADPDRLALLHGTAPVWLVDPLDGTANFASGREPFAVMVALLHGGVTEAAWVLDPVADRLMVASAGAGTHIDGVRAGRSGPTPAPPAHELRGAVATRYLPPDLRASVRARSAALGSVLPPQHCAGREYPDIVTGRQDFVVFWRTLPWDHAPGALLVRESGGVARRLDGSAYDPTDERTGLLVAASEEIWAVVHRTLFAPDHP